MTQALTYLFAVDASPGTIVVTVVALIIIGVIAKALFGDH